MEELKKNYMAEIAKNQNLGESFDDFFNYSPETDSEIANLTYQIKCKEKEIEEADKKLKESYAKKYKEKYSPSRQSVICRYESRKGDKFYYLMPSGQSVDYEIYKDRQHILINLFTKAGYVACLDGYAYNIGGIVTKNYKYNITQDNSKMNLSLLTEQIIPFFDETIDKIYSNNRFYVEHNSNILQKINATEFLNNMFGVSKKFESNLNTYRSFYRKNKLFETIIKTAPDELVELLLSEKCEENKPLYQLVGCTKETYNEAIKEGLIVELFEIAQYMQQDFVDGYSKSHNLKEIFNMTEHEWLEMIKVFKDYEEDLEFYGIPIVEYYYGGYRDIVPQTRKHPNTELLSYLASRYLNTPLFNKNYSFGKFVRYIINETINQGYTRVAGFLSELEDYLRMCETNLTIPCLYSSMLKLTHDISSRNNNVKVSPEDELKFQEKYKDFKEVALKLEEIEYYVLAPKDTRDIKKEGSNLGHCVASYIKKIIDGESLIYFLRKDKARSLITLEIRDSKITQAKGQSNRDPNEEEIKFIKQFAEKEKLEVAY